MKTFIFVVTTFVALAGVALAQEAPTVQSTADDANRIIQVLQAQRNAAQDDAAGAKALSTKAQAEVDKLRRDVAELKAKAEKANTAPAKPVDGEK